jgi:hypothetical protein
MAARPRRKRVRRRPYLASGHIIVAKAMPFLVERVTDPAVPETALTPLERTVRGWRAEILEDLGGDAVSAAKRAILDAAVGSKIILSSLDSFLFALAGSGRGLVNRRGRYAYRIVNDRMRVADSLVKQLATLGLDRQERPAIDLTTYLAQRRSSGARAESQATQVGDDHASDEPDRNADACP